MDNFIDKQERILKQQIEVGVTKDWRSSTDLVINDEYVPVPERNRNEVINKNKHVPEHSTSSGDSGNHSDESKEYESIVRIT